MSNEPVEIPQRWQTIYDAAGTYLNVQCARQLIEELGAAEAQLRQEREARAELEKHLGHLANPLMFMFPDIRAACKFAQAMANKLRDKSAEGKDGWEDPEECSVDDLARWMVEHLAKGDPVDIANFCMMLSLRGESGNGGAISRAWQAQIAQLQATVVQRWVSVKDQLPEDFTRVLVWDSGWNTVYDACYDSDERLWDAMNDREPPDSITHWMPLPEPPAALATCPAPAKEGE